MFKEFCYQLYKAKWLERISPECQLQTITTWFKEFSKESSFEQYLDEYGYNGELYASFNEFLNNEYLDESIMRDLLDDYFFEKYKEERGLR